MKTLVDVYQKGALLEGLDGRFKGAKVTGLEWLVEVVVDYAIQRNEEYMLINS